MDVQQVVEVECPACRERMTNQMMSYTTRRGEVVTFPCCLRCQSKVRASLEHEDEEMELEEEIIRNLSEAPVREAWEPARTKYEFVPSATYKRLESKKGVVDIALMALLTEPVNKPVTIDKSASMSASDAAALLAILGE